MIGIVCPNSKAHWLLFSGQQVLHFILHKLLFLISINWYPGALVFLELKLKKLKNLNFLGHVEYNKIPEILAKYNYAIMPYGEKVNVQSSNLDVSNTMSPLKMFDYLASSQVIFATDTSVYKHILKNNYNCVLIKHDKVYKWIKAIDDLKKNLSLKIKLKKNALKTAKKYTWDLRFKLIEKKFFTSLL